MISGLRGMTNTERAYLSRFETNIPYESTFCMTEHGYLALEDNESIYLLQIIIVSSCHNSDSV